ncbi:MAG: ABC transporter ATP-binding protein [Myxococcota bacterium]
MRTRALEHVYGKGHTRVHAVAGVSLEIPAGLFVCLMGPSGSGKSTLLHLLAGLRTPTSGEVWIGGTSVHSLSQDELARFRRANVGLVFQFFNLVPSLTVRQNIALPLLMDGLSLRHARERIDALVERLRITAPTTRDLAELSGGEMQRVAIARALISRPRVLLADEPTGNLDVRAGAEVLTLLRELCDERGVTVILMSHDPEARAYADRVSTLRDGRLDEPVPQELGT